MRIGQPSRCLFVQYTAEVGGSPISGLTVVDVLKDAGMEVAAVFGVPGPLEHDYRARGCNIYHLPHGQWLAGGSRLRRLRRWGREAKATWRFVRLVRRLQPEVVYVNTLMSIAALVAARALRIPVVWHVREQFEDVGGEMRWPLGGRRLVRSLVRRLPTRVVCISKSVYDNVLGPEPCPKASIIYNPLDARYFEPPAESAQARARLGLAKNGFLVGVPGTLRAVKGHEFFLEAAGRLARLDRTIQFALTGACNNELGRYLRRRCAQLGIEGRVAFLGSLDDMRGFYASCNLVCVPSRAEPFGRTCIEAFSQGRPVVATRVGGIVESVVEGKTGLLVDYGDVDGLVRTLKRLREDPGLCEALATRARRTARDRFHEDVVRHQLAEVLRLAVRFVQPDYDPSSAPKCDDGFIPRSARE